MDEASVRDEASIQRQASVQHQASVGAVAAPGEAILIAAERSIAFKHRNARDATDAALRWMRDPLLSEGFHVTSVIVTPEGEGFVATVSYRG